MSISAPTQAMPEKWYSSIEKSREKANKLLRKVVAVDMKTSIVVGKLDDVSLDKLFRIQYPFCKLTLSHAKKYNTNQRLEPSQESDQIAFVNKPEMIMDIQELSSRFPEIHADTHVDIKRGRFD
ncbi:MAG: hypothetical protein JW700_03305 [Candidatus Aenigmarchaeota archaeon]|nr:hypothetical protein [Candidatus Aenigmarchaeota archaeon]